MELFAGLGLAGILCLILIGGTFFAILPIWAIIDCSNSDRDNKTIIIVFLCLTWGLGSLVYSIFLTKTKSLRKFSIITFLICIVLFILSLSSCIFGFKKAQEKQAIEQKVENEKLSNELRDRGFLNTMKGQTFKVQKEITEPTYFEAQTFELLGDSTSDLFIKAQTCEIHGTVGGNLIFRGQVLTLQPKAVVKGNLEVDAQVFKKYGKVMGNVTGKVQVQEE